MTTAALLVIGAAVTGLSGQALWRAVRLALIGRRADGALVDWKRTFHERYVRSGHHLVWRQHFPVVEFEVPDGSRHTVTGGIGYDTRPDWPDHRPFAVRYAADNPDDATIDPLSPTWVFSAVFLAAGVVVLASAF
jgi:uncharacterized protein DUF3592